MKKYKYAFVLAILLAACANDSENETAPAPIDEPETMETSSKGERSEITVILINQDSETIGKAALTETEKGVAISIEAEGLPPGAHGFHIHEYGICQPEKKFETAGAHFNPFNKEHGTLNPKGPHAGDLPNLIVQNDGTVADKIAADLVTLKKGEKNSLIENGGTALIIHADPDDYKTDPAGNAGERIACGIIK